MKKRLIVIELNEVNLELAAVYANRNNLVNLKKIISNSVRRTHSETQYEDLEPWIQWVSVRTGKTAGEHGIFRLGDIVESSVPQYFEQIEAAGYSVGCVSAINAENRLKKPAYFIPDPWTVTRSDRSFWSEKLSAAISQAVNDNAQERLSATSILTLLGGILRFARLSNYARYLHLALKSRGAPWRKALFLDLFLHDLHLTFFQNKNPNFSTVFLNAGAYVQHHYLFNANKAVNSELRNPEWYASSSVDPFEEMLVLYDRILADYLAMKDVDVIVATGLTQKPYDRVKYYWRLKDHKNFLDLIGIAYHAVYPRMTRDFLVEFDSTESATQAAIKLSGIVCEQDGSPVFSEIDNRGSSLFVTLTYPNPIDDHLMVKYDGKVLDLKPHVSFVAIKNGMHDANGFVYYKGRVAEYAAHDGSHVKELYNVVTKFFGIQDLSQNQLPRNVHSAVILERRPTGT